jgi:DNA-3-methyladenine glycosylase
MPERLGRRARRSELAGPADLVAPRLIGWFLRRRLPDGEVLSVRIIETEAYLGVRDRASHSYAGRRTPRNEMMYARPGTAYVYFTYGLHWCLNVVCAEEGVPEAVLIRAGEPVEGLDRMRRSRAPAGSARRPPVDDALARGPACLTAALGIDRTHNGVDLTASAELWLEAPRRGWLRPRLRQTPRIGVERAGAWARRRLRWCVADHPGVSVDGGRRR